MTKSKLNFQAMRNSANAVQLSAGIHENIVMHEVERDSEFNSEGAENKRHLIVKFKKVNKTGSSDGDFRLSFFKLDPNQESALYLLGKLFSKIMEMSLLYYTKEEIWKKFNPFSVLLSEKDKEKSKEELENEFSYNKIKEERFMKISDFSVVEEEMVKQAVKLLSPKTNEDEIRLRLKLETDKKKGYSIIPRYSNFVELMSVTKKDSVLYNN